MNKIEALSFDKIFLEQYNIFVVDSIFDRSINLCDSQQKLLTLTSNKGIVNSICLLSLDLLKNLKLGDAFILNNNYLSNNSLRICLNVDKAQEFFWDCSSAKIPFFQENLEEFFDNINSQGILQFFKSEKNTINQFLFNKIQEIDQKYSAINSFSREIAKLYSGGIGSTPSMDDMILGMIISAKYFQDPIDVFIDSYQKTTSISRNMLLNALQNRFSDTIRDLYENEDPHKIQYFTEKIGSSSGIDMLVGTYFYIQKKGGRPCLVN
ncbi:MAG: DUF2877 domain-containing protein [Brevinemataceae bacterium]